MAKRPSLPAVNADVPCIYADDVANLSSSAGVLKFFLTRDDPPSAGQSGSSDSVPLVVAQIVMPKAKLIEMVAFFVDSLRQLEEKGKLYDDEATKERLRAAGIELSGAVRDE